RDAARNEYSLGTWVITVRRQSPRGISPGALALASGSPALSSLHLVEMLPEAWEPVFDDVDDLRHQQTEHRIAHTDHGLVRLGTETQDKVAAGRRAVRPVRAHEIGRDHAAANHQPRREQRRGYRIPPRDGPGVVSHLRPFVISDI